MLNEDKLDNVVIDFAELRDNQLNESFLAQGQRLMPLPKLLVARRNTLKPSESMGLMIQR